MSNPTEGIKDLLVAAGVGVFAKKTAWGIYISKEPSKPDEVITIYDSGGRSPNPKWRVDYPTVQIRIRGDQNGYQEARTKAQEVKDALLGLPSQDINGDRWVSISQIGDINFVGYEQDRRPTFTLNFSLIIEPASGTHRESL